MLLTGSRRSTPLPFGRDARLSYRRLRRPTRLPGMRSRNGIVGWLQAMAGWWGARAG